MAEWLRRSSEGLWGKVGNDKGLFPHRFESCWRRFYAYLFISFDVIKNQLRKVDFKIINLTFFCLGSIKSMILNIIYH